MLDPRSSWSILPAFFQIDGRKSVSECADYQLAQGSQGLTNGA
jgi:hypothetical protein